MTVENFLSFTEVDPNSKISKTASRVTWALLSRTEDAYVYKDKGVNYFSGNFECLLTYRSTGGTSSGTSIVAVCAVTNLIDDWYAITVGSGDELALVAYMSLLGNHQIWLLEIDGGTQYTSSLFTVSVDTDYYLKIVRDESVGTFGTLYCYIYSDAARTNLLATLSVALHTSKKDFRYIYAVQSANTGEAGITHSGYVENLSGVADLATPPTVLTHFIFDVTAVSAVCRGEIVSAGSSPVTQHGVCWSTSQNPTIADSKIELGAGTIGIFEGGLSSLIPATTYYVRTFATNLAGTAYGSQGVLTTLSGVPSVTTQECSDVLANTGTGNGNIVLIGTSAVTQHGHCWDTVENPTTTDSGSGKWGKTTNGAGSAGAFTSAITGLVAETAYYCRAYATNGSGPAYGAQVTLLPSAANTAPTVTTEDCEDIVSSGALGNGTISSLGIPATVFKHGHCWSEDFDPTLETCGDNKIELGAAAAIGAFTSQIAGLLPDTRYYVRAFATNQAGTGYGVSIEIVTIQGGYFTYPIPLARITGIIHRYDARAGVYQQEIVLGDITSTLQLPYEVTAQRATADKKVEQDAEPVIEEAVRQADAKRSRQMRVEESLGLGKLLRLP